MQLSVKTTKMPVLTKEQIIEAFGELHSEDQAEVRKYFLELDSRPLNLADEQKAAVLAELKAHDRNPQSGISWDEFDETLAKSSEIKSK